jgi:hypothetical protein
MVAPALTLTRPFPTLPAVHRTDWPAIWRGILEDNHLLRRLLRKREYLGSGSYGVVYEIAGAAVKIGCVEEAEVERQEWVHERFRRALPVWAFKNAVDLPRRVTREACPAHGYVDMGEDGNCHCGEAMAILVMPLAVPAREAWKDKRVQATLKDISGALWLEFQFVWDGRPRNLLRWNGRIVMADFGDENVDYW